MLPGVEPTCKRVDAVIVVIVGIEDEKVSSEPIHWDQASGLAQIGLLDRANLPVGGAGEAEKSRESRAGRRIIRRRRASNRLRGLVYEDDLPY